MVLTTEPSQMKPNLLILAATLGAGPAMAQTDTTPSAPLAPATPAGDTDALIQKINATYKTMRSYRCSFSVHENEDGPAAGTGDLLFAKPNKIRMGLKRAGEVLWIQSDGVNLYQKASATTYVKSEVPSKEELLSDPMTGLPVVGLTGLGALLNGGDLLKPGTTKRVEGKAGVDRFQGSLSADKRTFRTAWEFDATSHLLTQAEITMRAGKEDFRMVTKFSGIQPNVPIPTGTFSFKAPPGSRAITEEESNATYDLRLKPGTAPFAFTAKDLNGLTRSIAQYKGKVLLLDFWSTWCGPCVEELPNVKAVYSKYHKNGFEVLGISLDEDKKDLTDFLKENKIPWPQVFSGKAWEDPIAGKYGVKGIPCTFVIGRDGKIIAADVRGEELEKVVAKALKQK